MLATNTIKHYIACVAMLISNWPNRNGGEMEKMLKAKELADALSVNVETVRRWTRTGVIPHIKIGVSKRYSLDSVKQKLASTPGEAL